MDMSFASLAITDIVKRALRTALENRTLPNAYLFLGPEGVGKRTTAVTLAKALHCPVQQGDACDRCRTCQRIERDLHPDVHLVEPQGQVIKIDQVRQLQAQLALQAYEAGTKVAIVDDADKLTKEAANSTLKILEEPPARTLFILLCESLADLPATVLSRTQIVRFGTMPHDSLVAFLRQQGRSQAAADLAASLSAGRPGKALALDVSRLLDMRTEALGFLTQAGRGGAREVFANAEQWARRKGDHDLFFEMLFSLLRDLAVLSIQGHERHLLHADIASDLAPLASSLPRDIIWDIFAIIHTARHMLTHNANPQLALEVMLFNIGDAYERARHRNDSSATRHASLYRRRPAAAQAG
jgi:DNA polymerase-3 subunit delta'